MRISRIVHKEKAEINGDVDISLLTPVINKYRGKRGNLIPLLQATQDIYGYLPKEAFEQISIKLGIKLSDMYGVATFYSQFRLNPVGKHIVKVCHGTACHVQNARELSTSLEETLAVNDGETTEDGIFTLESVACLGCCSLAPVMMIGDETYGNLDGKAAAKVIKKIQKQEKLIAEHG
jgi:NADH-quinone oxidoreductase subunit E